MLHADEIITLAAGPYRLREPLAGSAYGVVWRADAPGDGPGVALKLINREQMARAQPALQANWIASANKEIAFLRSLEPWDERHIVRLLDSGEHQGLPVMALELMGSDLSRRVASMRSGAAPSGLTQVLDWIGQVNQALAKVHQYGWRYLDLKPANVLLHRHGGGVKLADFGTSRLRDEAPAALYSGTASWQAPEQFFPTARRTYDTDARTDYFALGAMFYYLVTGGMPLQFCSACGQAYRDQPAAAAPALLARHGGRVPPTLREEEAALFAHRIGGQSGNCSDATWSPARSNSAAQAALDLLRALLEPDRDARPRHAIQISRMLGTIRQALGSRA